MKLIEIPQHTIVMLIGPSNSGKSHFATKLLQPALSEMGVFSQYLSSDAIRRTLLGSDLHKHAEIMFSASKQAFEILHHSLDMFTQYPINTPVVIVDSTNLSRIARNEILNIAKKNAYNVVGLLFDYKDTADYLKYVDEDEKLFKKKAIFEHVRKLRKEVRVELDRPKYKAIYEIDSIDFKDVYFSYTSANNGKKFEHPNFCVFGDIHGCYEELIKMLQDSKGLIVDPIAMTIEVEEGAIDQGKYIHHVGLGDYVDKGPVEGQRKVIEFLHKNMKFFILVAGNHDRWVYNYLKGKQKPSPENDVLIANYFDSVTMLQQDEELRKKFFELYENMYDFAVHEKAIITHAPCENRYLGKAETVSVKKMNTTMYPKEKDYDSNEDYLDAREAWFRYLIEEGEFNYPAHVFGHVALSEIFQSKNKYGIDTGACYGNYLSTLIFMEENKKPFLRRYSTDRAKSNGLIPLFRMKMNEISFHALEHDLQTRIKWCAKNQVNFVSGTMSPCDKGYGEMESLQKGIEYFRSRGVTRIMLQPKFMGSRCNILLHKNDVQKCKAISRNAYEIKQERLTTKEPLVGVFKELQNKLSEFFSNNELEYVLLDGELLPWTVMGKDLIDRDFRVAEKAGRSELEILKESGFEELLQEFEHTIYDVDDIEVLPQHMRAWRKSYDGFKNDMLSLPKMEEVLDKYAHQLEIFGSEAPLEFKPFSILKTVAMDGKEENWVSGTRLNMDIYDQILKNDDWLMLDWDASGEGKDNFMATMSISRIGDMIPFTTAEEALKTFWKYVTEHKEMEGVVLKPDQVYVPGVAPFMKCRNKEYLRLTYGFDYDAIPVKTDRLMSTKNISRKLSTSVKEWELAKNLLDIPLKEVSVDNKKWVTLVAALLGEQEKEKELDPRL